MKTTLIVIAVLLAGAVLWFAVKQSEERSAQTPAESLQGEAVPILGRNHVPEGTKVTNYNSNPPTSGSHWPSPADWGFYNSSLPDEQLVHNLEHGGIWISYKDRNALDVETGRKLAELAEQYSQAVIITERPENETQFAVVSWGRIYASDFFDEDLAARFIQANVNNSPEPLASLEAPPVAVGNSFPNFALTEVDGAVVTNESFLGNPTIIWFTTEFCVPCQIGAREVSKLDDALGGSAFDVLVIFVDPRETQEDLRSWRERFARNDWLVAFDNFADGENSLSARVGLKFLDSKYLLDKDGVIQNIDVQIADEEYLSLIRNAVSQ